MALGESEPSSGCETDPKPSSGAEYDPVPVPRSPASVDSFEVDYQTDKLTREALAGKVDYEYGDQTIFSLLKLAEQELARLEAGLDLCRHGMSRILDLKDPSSRHWLGVLDETQSRLVIPVYGVQRAVSQIRDWLASLPYDRYLETLQWQEKRAQKRREAGNRCQVCNSTGPVLDVHHRTYERRGDERMEDLIVLCRDCHDIFHEHGKLAKEDY